MGAERSAREQGRRTGPAGTARAGVDGERRSGELAPAEVLALQARAGNAVVARAVRSGRIRAPRLRLARLVKNPFTDAAAWKDAAGASAAIDAYVALSAADRLTAVTESYTKDLVQVLRTLTKADQAHKYREAIREITRAVEEIETRASAGMTDDQIATTQRDFLKKQARTPPRGEAATEGRAAAQADPGRGRGGAQEAGRGHVDRAAQALGMGRDGGRRADQVDHARARAPWRRSSPTRRPSTPSSR